MPITKNKSIGPLQSKQLDHLGLVAATVHKLGIGKYIDEHIPLNKNSKTSIGDRVISMIFNGLGFIDTRLYMFSDFLQSKPVFKLFDNEVSEKDFNDDSLGRALDSISKYGTTKLFSELAMKIGLEHGLLGNKIHIDTTSLSLYGEYTTDTNLPNPKYGYAKNNRFDLKQMILTLATVGKSSFPVWMESHSGNASDQVILHQTAQRIQKFCSALQNCPPMIFVADSAIYHSCINNSNQSNDNLIWLSRVPESIKECKELIEKDVQWTTISDNYKMHATSSNHGNVQQRWFLYFSKESYEKEILTLEKNISKEKNELEKALVKLSNQRFICKADAQKAAKLKSKFHDCTFTINEISTFVNKGRPKEDAPTKITYQINGIITENKDLINNAKNSKGKFVLATNQDIAKLPDKDVLDTYKEQSGTESGFKFIKDNSFEIDNVFLKKPSRINALMMIMTLCLMVYSYAQYFIRQQLKKHNDTVPNQVKKSISNPTMKWIYKMFNNISIILTLEDNNWVYNMVDLNQIQKKIINYFGEVACKIYDIEYTK